MSTTRVRGLKAFLADVTNTHPPPPAKRQCAERAEKVFSNQLKKKAPRGGSGNPVLPDDTSQGGSSSTAVQDVDVDITTVKSLLDKRPEVLQEGFRCLLEFTERNTSYEIQKATTLQIFAGSVLRGSKILEACDLAAAFTPFSSRTVRRWAKDVFALLFQTLMM